MLSQNRLIKSRTAPLPSRGGFTLVELLVVIGIIAILAGVALGPITHAIKQAQENGALQVTRQIGLTEFSYSNDYQQTYPYGTSSELIADTLLNGGYLTDPSIFYQAGTPGAAKGSGQAPYTLGATNVNFDFTTTKTAGLSSAAADQTPLVELTGATYTLNPSGETDGTISTTLTAFGTDGIAIDYKSNSVKFLKGIIASPTSANLTNITDSSYNDPNAGTYKLQVP